MNKTLYTIVGHIPLVGLFFQSRTNFFAFRGSPFMAEFTKTNDYKMLANWLKQHPNQVVSPKRAKEILGKK